MNEELIKIVRRNLRSRGYRVNMFLGTSLGFELLVEKKIKVRVVAYKENACYTEGVDVSYDTIAAVSFDAAKRPVILYTSGNGPTVNARDIFGLPNKSKEQNEKAVEGKKTGKSGHKKDRSKKARAI